LLHAAGHDQVGFANQNGVQFGNFFGVTVDEDGIVSALFDNGQTQKIYKLPVATFPNPNGLSSKSGTAFAESQKSGGHFLRAAKEANAGSIVSSALESSTSDLANEFTNIISTLPADWPAQLIVARDGEQHEIHTRLLALPYQTHRRKPPAPDEDKKDDAKPKPAPMPRGPKVSIENPGEIRDEALNAENAQRIVRRWKEFTLASQPEAKLRVYHISDDVLRNGERRGAA